MVRRSTFELWCNTESVSVFVHVCRKWIKSTWSAAEMHSLWQRRWLESATIAQYWMRWLWVGWLWLFTVVVFWESTCSRWQLLRSFQAIQYGERALIRRHRTEARPELDVWALLWRMWLRSASLVRRLHSTVCEKTAGDNTSLTLSDFLQHVYHKVRDNCFPSRWNYVYALHLSVSPTQWYFHILVRVLS